MNNAESHEMKTKDRRARVVCVKMKMRMRNDRENGRGTRPTSPLAGASYTRVEGTNAWAKMREKWCGGEERDAHDREAVEEQRGVGSVADARNAGGGSGGRGSSLFEHVEHACLSLQQETDLA